MARWKKIRTVGDLRKMIENIPDDTQVEAVGHRLRIEARYRAPDEMHPQDFSYLLIDKVPV